MSETPIFQTKTFWAMMAGIFTTIGAYVAGEMELIPAIQACVGFLGGVFVRHRMKK